MWVPCWRRGRCHALSDPSYTLSRPSRAQRRWHSCKKQVASQHRLVFKLLVESVSSELLINTRKKRKNFPVLLFNSDSLIVSSLFTWNKHLHQASCPTTLSFLSYPYPIGLHFEKKTLNLHFNFHVRKMHLIVIKARCSVNPLSRHQYNYLYKLTKQPRNQDINILIWFFLMWL